MLLLALLMLLAGHPHHAVASAVVKHEHWCCLGWSTALAGLLTCRPKWIISRASTLAVVVPSPAESLVRPATCIKTHSGHNTQSAMSRQHSTLSAAAAAGWATAAQTAQVLL